MVSHAEIQARLNNLQVVKQQLVAEIGRLSTILTEVEGSLKLCVSLEECSAKSETEQPTEAYPADCCVSEQFCGNAD